MSAGTDNGPVTGAGAAETLEWRMRRATAAMFLLPALLLLSSALLNAADHFGRASSLFERILFWSYASLVVVNPVLAAGLCLRTRVRLTSTGVQVRQFRTRLYRYDEILDARRNRWASNSIQLVMRNEDRTILPVPKPGRRGAHEAAVDEALAAIRLRSGRAE